MGWGPGWVISSLRTGTLFLEKFVMARTAEERGARLGRWGGRGTRGGGGEAEVELSTALGHSPRGSCPGPALVGPCAFRARL